MPEPEFDRDGYPTEATLETIRNWPSTDDWTEFFEYVGKAWYYPDRVHVKENGARYFSTGGWSGNESIIDAMQENWIFWALNWHATFTGGHYFFANSEIRMRDDFDHFDPMNVKKPCQSVKEEIAPEKE